MGSRLDNGYTICSTEAGEPGGLVDVGRWSQDKGLQLSVDQVYRNTFRDFGHRQLRVGTQEVRKSSGSLFLHVRNCSKLRIIPSTLIPHKYPCGTQAVRMEFLFLLAALRG